MSPKKQYQKRLPSVHPPTPRPAPEQESVAPLAEPEVSTPPPQDPPFTPWLTPAADEEAGDARSGRALAVLVLLAVVSAAATGLVLWQGRDGSPDAPRRAAPVEEGWPPPGSSRTVTEVGADGVLEVTHWIHTTEPRYELDVALPETSGGEAIRASDVAVVADGQPASGPDTIAPGPAPYVFGDATRIRVRYRLSGAVERSTSAPGRALVTTTSLTVSALQPLDTRVVRAAAVLTLACGPPEARGPATTPCGEPDSEGQWTVSLTGADVGGHVVASVTLGP